MYWQTLFLLLILTADQCTGTDDGNNFLVVTATVTVAVVIVVILLVVVIIIGCYKWRKGTYLHSIGSYPIIVSAVSHSLGYSIRLLHYGWLQFVAMILCVDSIAKRPILPGTSTR